MSSPQELLRAAGEALYGSRWQSELAVTLDVADRTMRRWLAGQQMPEGVWAQLRGLLMRRSAECAELAEKFLRS